MNVALTREQVREVDRIAAEQFHISGLVLMENAGRNAARIILDDLKSLGDEAARVVIYCGTGNNGGDGFVVARHLVNAGVSVEIGLAGDVEKLSPDAAANHRICAAMGIAVVAADAVTLDDRTIIVDGLLGTGFTGQVRTPLVGIIERINAGPRRFVFALDVPSGMDCDTGEPSNATVRADVTITFAADKVGFHQESAKPYVGRVFVADIGSPPSIIDRVRHGGQ